VFDSTLGGADNTRLTRRFWSVAVEPQVGIDAMPFSTSYELQVGHVFLENK